MSEFTPVIMSMIPEKNFMQCISDTKISLSHAAFKNKLVGLDGEKQQNKSKIFRLALSLSSLCS